METKYISSDIIEMGESSKSNNEHNFIEPLLDPKNEQYTMFPIKHIELWKMYKTQQNAYWRAEEIDFDRDSDDFETLSPSEQHFIKTVLSFFALSDGIVNFNLRKRFLDEIKVNEALTVYGWQLMMESIHCVSGDTDILTESGYIKIGENLEKQIKIWNGKQFSDTIVKYTGKSKLFDIELTNGMCLKCTPEHKWFIRSESDKTIVYTKDLKINDILCAYELPIIHLNDPDEFKNPYIHGYFCGYGTYRNEYQFVQPYEKNFQFDVINKINKEKFTVPINYSIFTKLRWLEGLCDSDGCIVSNKQNTSSAIQLVNINDQFLKDIQMMLTTIGINSNIRLAKKKHNLPYVDVGDESKDYNSTEYKYTDYFVLYITCASVSKLTNLGFKPTNLQVKTDHEIKENSLLICIKKITELDDIHDTYCFSEPYENAGIFNGILTGQSETYSLMLDKIIKDPVEKSILFNAFNNIESIKMMADWAFKWIESSDTFAHRLIAFVCVEGIFFSGAFASIFWLKKYRSGGKNIMEGLIESNRLIARDEGMHVKFGCLLYSMIVKRLNTDIVHNIISEAVVISKLFVKDAIKCDMIGMNIDLMNEYIEYVADTLLVMLNYEKKYNIENPFPFIDSIDLINKTNFFEARPTEYQSAFNANNTARKKIVRLEEF